MITGKHMDAYTRRSK